MEEQEHARGVVTLLRRDVQRSILVHILRVDDCTTADE
jgi:hypothetical protein